MGAPPLVEDLVPHHHLEALRHGAIGIGDAALHSAAADHPHVELLSGAHKSDPPPRLGPIRAQAVDGLHLEQVAAVGLPDVVEDNRPWASVRVAAVIWRTQKMLGSVPERSYSYNRTSVKGTGSPSGP